jgi:hypothetical protein
LQPALQKKKHTTQKNTKFKTTTAPKKNTTNTKTRPTQKTPNTNGRQVVAMQQVFYRPLTKRSQVHVPAAPLSDAAVAF